MTTAETIAAQATAPGQAGIGIIRVAGPKALQIAQAITKADLTPRTAHYRSFHDERGTVQDQGIVLYFKAPHSFTGEDVIEFQGHGGQVILDLLLKRIVQLGARLARPGEFSERAFLNDKIDLVQAEAIADLIAATSEQAARSAQRSLQGEFSQRIHTLVERLIALRMYVEAAIDFPEEEIDFLSDGKVIKDLKSIQHDLNAVQQSATQGALLRDGIRMALVGPPNAGKSSLLNALTGQDSAIVTNIPGTTRDVLHEQIQLDGLPIHLVDTAGLRNSDDVIEQEGVRRAEQEIELADLLVVVIDHSQPHDIDDRFSDIIDSFAKKQRLILVRNKIDLTGDNPQMIPEAFVKNQVNAQVPGDSNTHMNRRTQGEHCGLNEQDTPTVLLSAKHHQGMDLLTQTLHHLVGYQHHTEGNFLARRRHLEALTFAADHLTKGETHLTTGRAGELLAEECRLAGLALSQITGEFRPDDLLGRIFSEFCIGK